VTLREEHVEASALGTAPHLEMADRLAVGEHEVGRHIGPHEPLEQRLACERLPVPEARNLRVGMPADEEVDVVVLDRAKRRLRP
jgi:hypothetical protein